MRTRGLGDLKTATTSRIHAKPPLKGTEYLNLYLLDKESQRLRQELAGLEHRQKRIYMHLADIRKAMDKAEEGAQDGERSVVRARGPETASDTYRRELQWNRIPVGY